MAVVQGGKDPAGLAGGFWPNSDSGLAREQVVERRSAA